jgi:transglutaminase-like putative cysteine protease
MQVVLHGGSCTGTGIVLVAAARSVGIPARLAGCPESVVRGDDHHCKAVAAAHGVGA